MLILNGLWCSWIRTCDFHRVKPSTLSITMTYKTLAAS